MNRIEIISNFLVNKLELLTGLSVWQGIAPETEINSHICFFIQDGTPINYTNHIMAFEQFDILIHNWNKDGYDYTTADLIQTLDGLQGELVNDSGFIQSCIYTGQKLIDSDIPDWYGIVSKFTIKVKNNENENSQTNSLER
ncbi:MAG: hypothetical protein IJS60_08855 [Abditibacteriota bacterium]|nr:hypothetical protein [Abditibacteriota bacterium]